MALDYHYAKATARPGDTLIPTDDEAERLNEQVWYAIKQDDLAAIEAAISAGYRVEPVERSYTALHHAAQLGRTNIISLLLRVSPKGAIDVFDDAYNNPLTYAAMGGHLETMKVLIDAGADVNAFDSVNIGDTALSTIMDECSFVVAEALLEAGADPLIPGWMQQTALARAEKRALKRADKESKNILSLTQRFASLNKNGNR